MAGRWIIIIIVRKVAWIIWPRQRSRRIFLRKVPLHSAFLKAGQAEKIIELHDENLRNQLGQNGQKAVKEKYNWKKTAQALLEIYKNA